MIAVKRLWIGKVTGIHIDCKDTAQAHYDRIVVRVEVDAEEELIRESRDALDRSQTLASVYHEIKTKVPLDRRTRVLKRVMHEKRREVDFICISEETSEAEILKAIRKWDVEGHMAIEKRARGALQVNRQEERGQRANSPRPTRPRDQASPRQSYSPAPQHPGELRSLQQPGRADEGHGLREQRGYPGRLPQQDRRQEPNRDLAPRSGFPFSPHQQPQGPEGPRGGNKGGFLSTEDYRKLDTAGKAALRAERERQRAGPRR